MHKLLLVANASSIWTEELIRNVHVSLDHQIVLADFDPVSKQIVEKYAGLNTKIVSLATSKKGILGKLCKSVKLLYFSIRYSHKFDMVVIHCPPNSIQAYFIAFAIRLIGCRTLTVFWGSDIQTINKAKAKRLGHIVRCSDCLNISTLAMRQAFEQFFPIRPEQKIYEAQFGSLAFSAIDKMFEKYTRKTGKAYWGLDTEKVCISIGYNGKSCHQHIKVIEALAVLSIEEKANIQLVLHLCRANEVYIQQVSEAAERSGIKYTIITQNLKLEEIAILRIATDIFLHAQTNDALSSSIRECIYAGAVLLNPKWIKYYEFDELGIDYIEYGSFEELSEYISSLLSGNFTVDTRRNQQIIGDKYSWAAVRGEWLRIFDENIT